MALENTGTVNRITANEMRKLFSENIFPQLSQGDLVTQVTWENHPSRPKANEPHCTKSQIVAYFDKGGMEIARVHRYLRTDGSLGASGKPDPKRIVIGGVTFRLIKGQG